MADDDESTCWICLAGAEEVEDEEQQQSSAPSPPPWQQPSSSATSMRARPAAPLGPLLQVCACPRRVHASCCARWQLHSAGKSEERTCRFCGEAVRLDYRNVMRAAAGARRVAPYMRVSFGGRTHKVPVAPGAEGAAQFEREIRRLLRLPPQVDFDVIFHCRDVFSGDRLKLQGLCAYDAAVTCASLAPQSGASGAAKRKEGEGGVGAAAAGAAGGQHHNHNHDPGSGSGSSSGSDYGGAPGVRASVDEGSGGNRRHQHQQQRASSNGVPCVGGHSSTTLERRRAASNVAAAAATAAVAAGAAARLRRRVSFEDEEGGGRRDNGSGGHGSSSRGHGGASGGASGGGGRTSSSLLPRAVSKLWTRVWGGPGGPAGWMERAILSTADA